MIRFDRSHTAAQAASLSAQTANADTIYFATDGGLYVGGRCIAQKNPTRATAGITFVQKNATASDISDNHLNLSLSATECPENTVCHVRVTVPANVGATFATIYVNVSGISYRNSIRVTHTQTAKCEWAFTVLRTTTSFRITGGNKLEDNGYTDLR